MDPYLRPSDENREIGHFSIEELLSPISSCSELIDGFNSITGPNPLPACPYESIKAEFDATAVRFLVLERQLYNAACSLALESIRFQPQPFEALDLC